jgi:hypothetical protein
MESIKTYKAILLAVAGIIVVVGSAYYFVGGRFKKPVEQVKARVNTQLVTGQVMRAFEGENKAVYSFYVPDAATTTTLSDGALVHVKENGALYMAAYLSYEGGRGYVAEEYINRVIAPQVSVIESGATSTIGSYTWTVAESANTEWHVAQVGDGQWLMVVENPKKNHDRVLETLDGLEVK